MDQSGNNLGVIGCKVEYEGFSGFITSDGSRGVPAEAMNSEAPSHHQGDPSSRNNDADDIQDMFHDVHETATESLHCEEVAADTNQVPNNGTTKISEIQITEEQKTRMESSRLKALERAAARARSLQAP
uniref:Uncharacterized protein n=1 Tax=Quercus lobata TaxID=97700 RepID=A0A7N2L8R2_QUELO